MLIGEIRDLETAENAIQASLTGHLVFSTLHTNDAAGAYTRMIDMGVEPFLVASTVEGVMAQRLVRRLCPQCKESYVPAGQRVARRLSARQSSRKSAASCSAPSVAAPAATSAIAGRMGIYELLVTTEQNSPTGPRSRQHLGDHPSGGGRRHGHAARRTAGEKCLSGRTTIEEVARNHQGRHYDVRPLSGKLIANYDPRQSIRWLNR